MTTSVLRKRVHEYIDQIDTDFLTIVHQLLEREVAAQEHFLSEADERMIAKRKKEMRSGKVKGIPHKTMMADLKAHIKKSAK